MKTLSPSLTRRTPSSRWPRSYLVCPEAYKVNDSLRTPVEVEVEVEKKTITNKRP